MAFIVFSQIDCLDPARHQRIAVLFSSFSYASENHPSPCVYPWYTCCFLVATWQNQQNDVCPAKTQILPGWSLSSLGTHVTFWWFYHALAHFILYNVSDVCLCILSVLFQKGFFFYSHYTGQFSMICWHTYLRMDKNINELSHEKMCLISYANNKGADQPAHPCSLISTFVFAA